MPGIGDQHTAFANPYNEVKRHIIGYTAQEIATLSSRLEKQLGPEYISTRPGPSGQRVPYLPADKCINLANEVFGFNGWSSGIQQIQIDFVDENQSTGKVSLGLSVLVRVTLKDGTYHEVEFLRILSTGLGYGHIENCKGKAAAFEKAKKEGTTDALKRALRNFGNILGNCVYDKDYISKVTKIRVAPSRWDPENLHRHSDYAPLKKEPVAQIKGEKFAGHDKIDVEASIDHTDDFDEADFSVNHETSHDESSLEHMTHVKGKESIPTRPNVARYGSANGVPSNLTNVEANSHPQISSENRLANANQTHQGHIIAPTPRQSGPWKDTLAQGCMHPCDPPFTTAHDLSVGIQSAEQTASSAQAQDPPLHETTPTTCSISVPSNPPLGFFTARAAESVQTCSGLPLKAPSFNLHLESPSIRKTAGVDHSKTKPVGKDVISPALQLPAAISAANGRPNLVNPQADKARRVGMPVGSASPLSNRGSYKPPQMKRGADGNPLHLSRPALGDVTSTTVNAPGDSGGGDAKRQKTGGPIPSINAQNCG
ncbi:MAG: hypothetical protein LQ341_002150 [Variospora aurantia]|nr:MAG: hypothetical protein LQ341_002150 [Variospora aurantia]